VKNVEKVKVGIIICSRYRNCGGGKCLRAARNLEGGFSVHEGKEVEIVGYSSCGGCPGGNVEYVPAEMKKNGAQYIHLATGMIVGYPPCPNLRYFKRFIEEKYGLEVILGTHPIPENYFRTHLNLRTWDSPTWQEIIDPLSRDEALRKAYD
jgi:predicted metal-binding protein